MPLRRFGHCSPSQAAEASRVLLGLYPKGSAEDPETYVAGVATVLASYPPDIVREVCSPWGIGVRIKWLPSLYEIKECCEIAMGPYYEREAAKLREVEDRRQQIADERRYGPNGPLSEEQMAANRERFDKILGEWRLKMRPFLSPSEQRRVEVDWGQDEVVKTAIKAEAEAKLATIKPVTKDEVGSDLRKWIDRCIDASGAR